MKKRHAGRVDLPAAFRIHKAGINSLEVGAPASQTWRPGNEQHQIEAVQPLMVAVIYELSPCS